MGVMEAFPLVSPFFYFERKVPRVALDEGGILVDDGEWMVDISRREWKSRKGARRNLMKQMETRVNCANTGRRDGMNGGRREKGNWRRTSEMAEAEIGRKRDWGTARAIAEKDRAKEK